jgi:hypothetical protein
MPTYPVFDFYDDFFEIVESEDHYKRCRGFQISQFQNHRIYDSKGTLWSVTLRSVNMKKPNGLLRFINQFRLLNVIPIWEKIYCYDLSELKGQICSAINKDDDVLTQFVEPGEFKKRVMRCSSIGRVYDLIHAAIIYYDEDKFNSEF